MDATNALLIALLIAAIVVCVAAVWALRELVQTSRSVRVLSDDLRAQLLPLLEKADVTIDAANAELLRVDGVITVFEDASVRLSAASGTLSEMVHAPAGIVTGISERVRRAWKDRRTSADFEHEDWPAEDATAEPSEQELIETAE